MRSTIVWRMENDHGQGPYVEDGHGDHLVCYSGICRCEAWFSGPKSWFIGTDIFLRSGLVEPRGAPSGAAAIREAHSNDPARPGPDADGIQNFYGSIFGFPTRELGERWFYGWIAPLRAHGFTLREVKATDVRLGKSKLQLCFKRLF